MSKHNKSLYISEDENLANNNPDISSWTDLRAKFLLDYSSLDHTFPSNFRYMQTSQNIINLG
jgi:hypothetical protein